MNKYIFAVLMTLFIINIIIDISQNRERKDDNSYFGKEANEIRSKLNIPIIQDNMESKRLYNGQRWDSPIKFPNDREALHLWKIVTLPKYFGSIYEEKDAFRKKFNDTLYQQLNIYNGISCDTIVKRQGNLFFVGKVEYPKKHLNAVQVDSVLISWGVSLYDSKPLRK
jgi:hypothetical protein